VDTLTDHLRKRHLDVNLHRPVLDDVERVVTFFLYNLSGQVIGYQQYRPEGEKKPQNNPKAGKYFTYKKQPTLAVWGVESLHLTPHVVFLTEGLFDAARLTERGYSALAALSNDPTPELGNWLWCLNRRVVAVCDNDKAGKKLAKFGDQVALTVDKDLGDSPDEVVVDLLARFG
jgi:DNA primase